jgi:hypothetical protein
MGPEFWDSTNRYSAGRLMRRQVKITKQTFVGAVLGDCLCRSITPLAVV